MLEDLYRRARWTIATTQPSARVKPFGWLMEADTRASDFERGKRLQAKVLATIRHFGGGDRLSREDAHARSPVRPRH